MAKNPNKDQKNTKKENIFKRLAENRYAKFQYAISETIEAGIELLGTEVKSIRNGKANLRDGYCSFRDSERPETVLQHMLIADPDPSPPPSSVSLDS